MMDRRHWHVSSGLNCAVCTASEKETKEHLFFNCTFARKVWRQVGISWASSQSMTAMFESARNSFQGPKFIEVAVCALWGIWKCCNKKIFENIQPSLHGWRAIFKYDLELNIHRVKPAHKKSLSIWLQNL
jgi:hypothetical protein